MTDRMRAMRERMAGWRSGLRERWARADHREAALAAGSIAGVLVVVAIAAVLLGGGSAEEERPRTLTVTPSGAEAPRLGPIVISFVEPPSTAEAERLVSIEPAPEGQYVWLDDRTLLFQPAFPGLQRGGEYLVRVAGGAGQQEDFVQAFTVEGKLEVLSTVPSAGDSDVPPEARIYVQFSRSVAPLTILAEQPTDTVLEFEPSLTGTGEWLNTSVYMFTPDDLQPATTYRVRVPAGLTSMTDGVLEADYEWEFSTYQPALAGSTPANGTSFAGLDQTVELVFNQPMDRASVEAGVRVASDDGDAVAFGASWSDDSTTVTLTPRERLGVATQYRVTIPAGLSGATGGAMPEERTLSFRTVELPRVVNTSPRDGETQAGRYGFNITFNNPVPIEEVEDHLTISGFEREDWRVYSWDERQVQVDVAFEPSTSYTVTLEGASDRAGMPIDPLVVSFTTGALDPQVSYAVPSQFSTYAADGEQRLYFYATNLDEVQFELWALDEEAGRKLLNTGQIPFPGTPDWKPAGDPTRTWSETVEGSQNRLVQGSTLLGGEEALAPGFYYVRSPQGSWASGLLFAVVDTGLVTKLAMDELLVWAFDHDTGEPLPGVTLDVVGGGVPAGTTATTDAEGLASVPVPRPSEMTSTQQRDYAVTTSTSARFGVTRTDWAYGAEPWALGINVSYWDQDMVAHVYTDRPIYRSGETVHFKAIVRRDEDARYLLPEAGDSGLTLVITDAQGEDIQREPLVVNDFGTAAGSVELPEEATTGHYQVTVRQRRAGGENWIAGSAFQVAEFRTPEFRVEATPVATDIVDGDTIEIDVEASFFFGGPLAGAEVEWTAHAFPSGPPFGRDGYSYSDIDYYAPQVFEEPLRASGEAVTDASGVARIEVPGVLRAGESAMSFEVSASVLDQSGQAIGASASVRVHPSSVYAGIRTAEYVGRVGEASEIQVQTVDIHGEVVGDQPVTVEVYDREWVTTVERASSGARRYRSEPRDTLLATLQVTTGADGLGRVEYTPESTGVLRLMARTSDAQGREARSAGYLWVAGEEFARWEIRNDSGIELVADRAEYEVGDTAEVLVPAPFAGAQALVTIERGGILEREVRVFESNSETLSIPITDEHVPNVFVSVVLYRPPSEEDPIPRYHVGYVDLPVSTAPRELTVTVAPSVEQARPGETVRYDITVVDSVGEPVEAELSVDIVDAAVLSLSDIEDRSGLEVFWFRRGLGVRTGSSVSVSVDRANDTIAEAPGGGKGGGEEGEALRTQLRNTALWEPQLMTDAQGRASVELRLPDNLTTWRTRVRAVSGDTLVGEATHELLSTTPLLVRPALPRFMRVGDEVMLRTLVRNATGETQDVAVDITVEGLELDDTGTRTVTVAAGQSGEFEWAARATSTGTATVAFRASAGNERDGVEISLPVHLDVTPETMSTGGVVGDTSQLEALYLPEYALTEQGALEVAVQGSIVGALVDELRHLEPTPFENASRIASRVIATIAARRAEGVQGDEILDGLGYELAQLLAMQRADGAWGWCGSASCRPDATATAWVLVALGEAREAGWDPPGRQASRAESFLRAYANRVSDVRRPVDPNERVFIFYALQYALGTDSYLNSLLATFEQHRESLTGWGRAYLILGLLDAGQPADDRVIRALIADLNASVLPSANGNHWEGRSIYGTLESNVSMTALILKALVEADPQHPLIEETARWVVEARNARRWQSTIERAQALRGLGPYAALTGERAGDFDFRVVLDGSDLLTGHLAPGQGSNTAERTKPLRELSVGEVHHLAFERERTAGRLYYLLNLHYTTPAANVEAVSRGISVARQYTLLDDPDRPVTEAELGELVRVTVTVVADADRKFVQVEDLLPAGLEGIDTSLATVTDAERRRLEDEREEAVAPDEEPRAYAPWYRWYWSPWDETNVRDDRFTMFATELPRGVHEYVYYARATTPGDFFAAPAHVQEAPFPEVFGRSDSGRFTVTR